MRRLLTGIAAGLVAGSCVGLADAIYVLTSGPPSDYLALSYAVVLYAGAGLVLGTLCGLLAVLLGLVAPAAARPHRVYTGSFGAVFGGLGLAVAGLELDRAVYLDRGLPLEVQAALGVAAFVALGGCAWLLPILLTRTPFKIVLRLRGTAALVGVLVVLSAVFSLSPVAGGDPSGDVRPARLQDEALILGPDLLLVVVDSLRPDQVGAYGAAVSRTPAIDGLAARGITFERAASPSSWTRGAFASLLGGQVPAAHGVRDRRDVFDPEALTLPEQLQARGWVTGVLFDQPDLVQRRDLTQGFDWAPSLAPRPPMLASRSASRLGLYRVARRFRTRRLGITPGVEEYYQPAEVVLDRAREFVVANRDRRWFLTVHLMDSTPPLLRAGPGGAVLVWEGGEPPTPGREDEARQAYDEAVARLDAALGAFLAWLAEGGDDPLVVLTATHGLALGEHGDWGAGTSLFDEQIRVPLIVALPGGERAGSRVAAQAGLVDLAPTLAAWGGAAVPVRWQGRDLLATDLPADRDLLAEGAWNDLYAWALLSGGWKLVRGGGEEDKGTSLLYDLGSDPGEIDDRAAREPALRERLERQLSLRLQEAEELRAGLIGGPLDEETAERVRSLGVSGE